jgi:hypothetical protein
MRRRGVMTITPTNVCTTVILDGQDYGLKTSVNPKVHREPDLSPPSEPLVRGKIVPYIPQQAP